MTPVLMSLLESTNLLYSIVRITLCKPSQQEETTASCLDIFTINNFKIRKSMNVGII